MAYRLQGAVDVLRIAYSKNLGVVRGVGVYVLIKYGRVTK